LLEKVNNAVLIQSQGFQESDEQDPLPKRKNYWPKRTAFKAQIVLTSSIIEYVTTPI
jgi:hypothetical protein